MKIFGLAGWSGSGKTTLVKSLIPELTGRGLSVSTIKHAHHAFDIDKPGKDSFAHRQAGATEVLVGSARRWALIHELQGAPEPTLEELVARMSPVDILIIEGFKFHAHPKLEVRRAGLDKPRLFETDNKIVAIASDHIISACNLPFFDLNDVKSIADFILDYVGVKGKSDGAA